MSGRRKDERRKDVENAGADGARYECECERGARCSRILYVVCRTQTISGMGSNEIYTIQIKFRGKNNERWADGRELGVVHVHRYQVQSASAGGAYYS